MYRINGNLCTKENGCLPSRHRIGKTQLNPIETVGGIIVIEPTSGVRRTHTWTYDRRTTKTIQNLRSFLDLASSPIVTIDTYDVVRNADGTDVLLTNVECMVQEPDWETAGKRSEVDTFSLTFVEAYVQS